jgi:ParB family chromosome partitioning protein
MSKLDQLRKTAAGNAAESMGPLHKPAMHGASPALAAGTPERLRGVVRSKEAVEIPTDRIAPDPEQPREEFESEALARLAESLKARGQLQPIRVRWDEGRGVYVILIGERRWRAAKMAGIPSMAALVVEGNMEAAERLAVQLVENCLREDLRPLEQARAFKALMDAHGWSTHQVARELAITQSSVVRALAMLDLPAAVQAEVESGALAPATAYEVSKLIDPTAQTALAEQALAGKLTRQEVAEVVRQRRGRRTMHRASGRREVRFRVADGVAVAVCYRRRSTLGAVEALERALAQARAEAEGQEAA